MSVFLDDLASFIKSCGLNVFSAAEIVGDSEPETVYLQPSNPCNDVYSVAKAFSVTAIGILSDRGLLNVDETVTELLGDELPERYDPLWESTTLDSLMLHKLGLPRGFLDIDCVDANTFGKDYLAYVMGRELTEGHGIKECYTDAAYYIVSRIAEKRSGMALDDLMWKELFFPLGVREAAWSHCPLGHAMGATGLYIRSEDMARLMAVYLNKGIYRGRRYLSEAWVDKVLSRGYEIRRKGDNGAYGKGGMRGQMAMAVFDTNRAVAWQAFDSSDMAPLVRFVAEYKG